MKILILQLARFGDIFITWPTLRAVRRKYPTAEIHLVVRQRFVKAAEDCEAVDHVITLNTADILNPLFKTPDDLKESLLRLSDWTDDLKEHDYDLTINLSFSPFSSYLTSLLTRDHRQVRGYTRHQDGYLAIPDDPSSYFYAQVGLDRSNRYHLAEIFAAVADVELIEADWRPADGWNLGADLKGWRQRHPVLEKPYIVLHPGASQIQKAYPGFKWQVVLSRLSKVWDGHVVMIGSASDQFVMEEIFPSDRLLNLADQTSFSDVVALMSGAKLVVGCDSAPMHLASFTKTPCVNLSFASVCFWETGPRVPGSRVVYAESSQALPSDRVVEEIMAALQNRNSGFPIIRRSQDLPIGYNWENHEVDDFAWRLIQAIYTGAEWPVITDSLNASGMQRLADAVALAQEQLVKLKVKEKNQAAAQLLGHADQAIHVIGQMVPDLRPLISWFETQNLRIGPMPMNELVARFQPNYDQLAMIIQQYVTPTEIAAKAEL